MPSNEEKEAILAIATIVPGMIVRLGISFLRMKRQVNRSAKSFCREMVRNGVPPEDAKKLTDEYTSISSFRHWLREVGGFS